MQAILAILLYLNAICTCTYEEQQINQTIQVWETEITTIQNDPELSQQIYLYFEDEAESVVIIDLQEGGA